MGTHEFTAAKRQAGFTLVELAVVMIIIGLLIGGVLKGQELIANAQVTGTASAIKGIDAATTTFRDTYAALPGDMTNATNRLPNCTAAPCVITAATLGNGRVDGTITGTPSATGEMAAFWTQLSAADLLTGINPAAASATTSWGGYYPKAPIAGGFHASFSAATTLGANTNARAGHYLVLNNNPGGTPNGTALSALQAARLDRKLDDGSANTGTVFPLNGTTPCNTNATYNENTAAASCDLFIRFQN